MAETAERIYERLLVLRCQTGEASAFAELVTRYDRRLRFFIRKLANDGGLVDDLVQEVWLDVFRGVARLRDAGAFTAWFYRLARDRVFRHLRRRPSPRPLTETELDELSVDDDDFDADAVESIQAALSGLPPEQREILVLRFIEGMDYETLAAVVGVPVGTVRSRLHYAKRALRTAVERMEIHERERAW